MKLSLFAILGSLEVALAIQCYQDMIIAVPKTGGGFLIGSVIAAAGGASTVYEEGSTCYGWESTNVGGGALCLAATLSSCPTEYTWGSRQSCTTDRCNTARAYVGVQSGVEYFTCITANNCNPTSATVLAQVNGGGCFQSSDAGCPTTMSTTTTVPKCAFSVGAMSRSDLTCATDSCSASGGDTDSGNKCTCEREYCDRDTNQVCQCLALKGGCGDAGSDENSDSGVNNMQIGQIRELCPGSCNDATRGEIAPTCSISSDSTKCLLGGAAIVASSVLL